MNMYVFIVITFYRDMRLDDVYITSAHVYVIESIERAMCERGCYVVVYIMIKSSGSECRL